MEAGLKYLNADRLHHLDMLEALRRGTARPVYMASDGAFLIDDESGWCLMSAATPETGAKLIAMSGEASCFCVHQQFIRDMLGVRDDFCFYLECVQTAYLGGEPPAEPDGFSLELRALTPDMAEWVNANYRQDPDELGYVRWLLERGVIKGAFENGECAGFMGRHSDGSLGLLNVRPEYRRRGIGEALLRDAIRSELALGNIPFGQIVVGNEASIGLNLKVGMTVSDSMLWWLEKKSDQ